MPTKRKSTARLVRQVGSSIKLPKPPRRIFEPNRPADRYRGMVHKREQVFSEDLVMR